MLDYLLNSEYWKLEWSLQLLGNKAVFLPLIAAVFLGRFKEPIHLKVILFALYSYLMDHVTTDVDLKNLFHPDTNVSWYHLLVPGLFLLMTRFFSDYLDHGKLRFMRWLLPLIFTLLVLMDAIYGVGFYAFPSRTVGLYSMSGIILSIGYFVYLINKLESYYLERNPMFWVCTGLLIYFAGNFLLWLGINYINYDRDFFKSIYRINSIVAIFLHVSFTVAICLKPNEPNLTA